MLNKIYRVRVCDESGDGRNIGVYSSREKAEVAKARWKRKQVQVEVGHFLAGVYFPKLSEQIHSTIPYTHGTANLYNKMLRHAKKLLPKHLEYSCDDECYIIEEIVK